MYGQTPQRNFYIDENLGDSLKLKWEYSTSAGTAFTSVTAKDSVIFIGTLRGKVHAIDLITGKRRGEIDLKEPIYSSIQITRKEIIAALAHGKSSSTDIVWYDVIDGSIVREKKFCGSIENEILLYNDNLIFTCDDGALFKIDKYGTVIWKINTGTNVFSVLSCNGEQIIVGGIDGSLSSFDFVFGKLNWKINTGAAIYSGAIIENGFVYTNNHHGNVLKININDGSIIWKYNADSKLRALLSYDSENLYFGDLNGTIYSIDKLNGKIIWKISSGGIINNSILVFKNKLVVPLLNKLVLILDKNNGKVLQKIEFPGRVKLSPIYLNKQLIFGCDDDLIISYQVN